MGDLDTLAPALLRLLDRAGEGGLKLSVSVRAADEVQDLRKQVAELQAQLEGLKAVYNRCEFAYRCESLINMQITDYCRELGVSLPRRLFQRPYSQSGDRE